MTGENHTWAKFSRWARKQNIKKGESKGRALNVGCVGTQSDKIGGGVVGGEVQKEKSF